MRKRLLAVVFAVLLMMAAVMPVAAHTAGPCDDSDGDGAPSGHEYAEHHIVSLATIGGLGNDGHKPGSHQGFSACDPSSL